MASPNRWARISPTPGTAPSSSRSSAGLEPPGPARGRGGSCQARLGRAGDVVAPAVQRLEARDLGSPQRGQRRPLLGDLLGEVGDGGRRPRGQRRGLGVLGPIGGDEGIEERRSAPLDDLRREGAVVGPGDPKLALGPGHRDVEEAGLLGPGGRGAGMGDGHVPVLHAGEVHHAPLEALGGVEGRHVDGVAAEPRRVALRLHRGRAASARRCRCGRAGRGGGSPDPPDDGGHQRGLLQPGLCVGPRRGSAGSRSIASSRSDRALPSGSSTRRSSRRARRTSGRSRKAAPPRIRWGIPASRRASVRSTVWAWVRTRTAWSDQRRPGAWARRTARATATASSRSEGCPAMCGASPSARTASTSWAGWRAERSIVAAARRICGVDR